uniref:Uncharacterized protein n=1 Tax=Macrostomum lignano TaxID=282301 RepID=A0A1I8HS50_9PLAT
MKKFMKTSFERHEKTVAQRQQQQQQKPADSDRANSKPVEQDEVKENIEPQQTRKTANFGKSSRRIEVGSKWRRSGNDKNASEFERQMISTSWRLGKSWQCQANPELSYKDVNYQEGSMAVLVTPQQNKRVMVWRPQPTGGMCCCC